MKKPLIIITIIVAVILALPFALFLKWAFQEKKPLDIIVVDKTVPTISRLNHKSFMWVLNNERFVKKENKSSYSFRKDYYGFYPLKPLREKQFKRKDYRLAELIELAEANDALFFADTYGVFFNDWYQGLNKNRRSRKLYGGLNNNDYLLMVEMKNRNKLVVLEYNTFDYPTASLERYKTEEQLGIKFTGWTGKHFHSLDSLSKDFPVWITGMYRKMYNKPWTYTGSGVVLIKDNRDVIVLEEGKELQSSEVSITTIPEFAEKHGLPAAVSFTNWFDIVQPINNNVISSFNLNTTAKGDSILYSVFLSKVIPAVIQEPENMRTYYIAGDFTFYNFPQWTSKIDNIEKVMSAIRGNNAEISHKFFWDYYRNLMKGIFDDYYYSMEKK